MKVEQIKDNGEEVRLRVFASAAEMSKAFTDGLDAFVVQYQMDQLEGESSLEKINNALGEEDGKAAVYQLSGSLCIGKAGNYAGIDIRH